MPLDSWRTAGCGCPCHLRVFAWDEIPRRCWSEGCGCLCHWRGEETQSERVLISVYGRCEDTRGLSSRQYFQRLRDRRDSERRLWQVAAYSVRDPDPLTAAYWELTD